MPARWLEVSIRASAEAAEALNALFERSGHGGVVVEPELRPGPEVDQAVPAPGAFSLLRTYLPEGADLPARRRQIEELVGVLRAFDLAPMGDLGFRWIGEEDWAEAWKRHYAVQRIGRHWVIKPRWQSYAPRAGRPGARPRPGDGLRHRPAPHHAAGAGSAGGPGDAGEVQGRELLDLGTGSGILAIGAGRLGAASVLALDVDEVAVRAAADNVAQNGLAGVVRVQRGTVGDPAPGVVPVPGSTPEEAFDGALANIVARVIAERAPALARALRPGRLAGGQRDHRRARGGGQRPPGGAGAAHRAAPAARGLGDPALPRPWCPPLPGSLARRLARPGAPPGRRESRRGERHAHRAPLPRPRAPGGRPGRPPGRRPRTRY